MEHRMSQKKGREKLFERYKITVFSVIREYSDADRKEVPADSNEFFGQEHPVAKNNRL